MPSIRFIEEENPIDLERVIIWRVHSAIAQAQEVVQFDSYPPNYLLKKYCAIYLSKLNNSLSGDGLNRLFFGK